MLYLVLKTVHVLAAVLFLGAGLASAFYKVRAFRSGDLAIIVWCDRQIVLADWLLTVPSGVLVPATGLGMVVVGNIPWNTPWILIGIVGYAVAGLTWLPAAFLQIRMRRMAEAAVKDERALGDDYRRAQRTWFLLGIPAFLAALVVVCVMVLKTVA